MSAGGQRSQDFVGLVNRFATESSDPRIAAIAARMSTPVRVAVVGRRGVGRRTVARALQRVGTAITPDQAADLVVYVLVEVAKPEDASVLGALRARGAGGQPVLVVLNKTDLTGRAAVADVAARLTAPVEAMAALLAVAALDGLNDPLWHAVQALAAEPAGLGSAADFLTGPHPLPRQVRLQLCETLDVPGITRAVTAVRQGWSAAQVYALLRRLSGVDAVAQRLNTLAAVVRYQRLLDAVAQLEAQAAGDGRICDFLSHDDTVVARMAAALEVVEAAGLAFDVVDAAARLETAARWQQYGRGPLNGVHRACADDIARGLLRLWAMTAEPARVSV